MLKKIYLLNDCSDYYKVVILKKAFVLKKLSELNMSGTVVSAANGADRKQWKAVYKDETKDDVNKDILKQLNLPEIREIKNTKEIDEEINKKNNNPPLDN